MSSKGKAGGDASGNAHGNVKVFSDCTTGAAGADAVSATVAWTGPIVEV
jgi:hypothetical protein